MEFLKTRTAKAEANWSSGEVRNAAKGWHDFSRTVDYQYMFEFCGLPVIQDPQDVCMLQEVIWKTQPTVIIETGIARGGSLILSAAILAARSYSEVLAGGTVAKRRVIGVDIDIRPHNRAAIESHPLAPMITLIEGSSIDGAVAASVRAQVNPDDRVLVILDSNHTEEHVLNELELYASLVTPGSAVLVMDTGIEFAPPETFSTDRPWFPGSNPYSATKKFLGSELGMKFRINQDIEKRHLITCAPEGMLVRIR